MKHTIHPFIQAVLLCALASWFCPGLVHASTLYSSPSLGGDLISTCYSLYTNFKAVAWIVVAILCILGFVFWNMNKGLAIGAIVGAIGIGITGALIEFMKASTQS